MYDMKVNWFRPIWWNGELNTWSAINASIWLGRINQQKLRGIMRFYMLPLTCDILSAVKKLSIVITQSIIIIRHVLHDRSSIWLWIKSISKELESLFTCSCYNCRVVLLHIMTSSAIDCDVIITTWTDRVRHGVGLWGSSFYCHV